MLGNLNARSCKVCGTITKIIAANAYVDDILTVTARHFCSCTVKVNRGRVLAEVFSTDIGLIVIFSVVAVLILRLMKG